jgi:hypothetical protein
MAKKNKSRTKKAASKNAKKPKSKKLRPRKKVASKKIAAPKRSAARKKPTRVGRAGAAPRRSRRSAPAEPLNPVVRTGRGLGADSAGQSGDIQGLSRRELADSESVTELAEEGQDYEAGIVEAIENTPDADQGEIRTKEVPEDDVPDEYLDTRENS